MANTKISALTADTAPTADDLVVTVNDPGGTPATRKATITNFTKAIPVVVGDSGSGGTKGLVPAPGAGDAAAGKFLKADGTFAVPAGSGAPSTATYITQTADGGLSAEQALGSLATGILKSTTTTGVVSIADVNDISSPVYAADAGSTDAYAATLSPAPTGYVTGAHYRFKANTANTTACTIDFNSLGAKTIKKVAGGITTDLATNDIRAGQWVDLVYDGTNMQMQSTLGNAAGGGSPGGSDTQVQFNDSSAFGGDADLTWNKTTNTLAATAAVSVPSSAAIGNGTVLGVAGLKMNRDSRVQWSNNAGAWDSTTSISTRMVNGAYGIVVQSASDAEKTNPGNQRWVYSQGGHRCTANFAKASNTSLATITGCSVPIPAGGSDTLNYYTFIFEAEVDCDATGGYKFAVAYSGSLDEGITYFIQVIDEADGSIDTYSRQTSSGGSAGGAGPTAIHVRISGNLSIATAGNLTIQFAQNVASGTSTVLELGSLLTVTPIID